MSQLVTLSNLSPRPRPTSAMVILAVTCTFLCRSSLERFGVQVSLAGFSHRQPHLPIFIISFLDHPRPSLAANSIAYVLRHQSTFSSELPVKSRAEDKGESPDRQSSFVLRSDLIADNQSPLIVRFSLFRHLHWSRTVCRAAGRAPSFIIICFPRLRRPVSHYLHLLLGPRNLRSFVSLAPSLSATPPTV